MLFITVPAGIILCGAASGIAKALEGGLRERLMKIIIGESRKQTLGSRRKRALRLTKAKKQNQFK